MTGNQLFVSLMIGFIGWAAFVIWAAVHFNELMWLTGLLAFAVFLG